MLPAMTADGVCICNVIAGRRKLRDIIHLWEELFGSVYILATDPNYFFVGTVRPMDATEATPERMVRCHEPAAERTFAWFIYGRSTNVL